MLEDIKPHIAELRERLIKIVASYFVAFIVVFMNWQVVYAWMKKPLEKAFHKAMIFTSLTEPFITALKISLYTGFVLALPIIMYQVWKFIAPALYENEKKAAVPFVFWTTVMFLSGVAFAYYVVFPFGANVLINFGGVEFEAMLKMSEYIGFFAKFMFGFGIAFELPVFSYFLAKLDLITDKTLISGFRFAVVIIFIVAAILTPPDPATQFMMAIPLIILYGVSILIVKMVNPEQKEAE
ncbi:MAG: twin-arginine translocase subunit TatC [Epsilonproteobacteria bacterium]|nr:twin-arginine translocase subunit TatC [Campylobacterota bacterium]